MTCGEAFNLDGSPNRIECFDISHTGGTDTVASCVVFGVEGTPQERLSALQHRGYSTGRRTTAAMYQALTRRYKRVRDGVKLRHRMCS